MFNKVVLVGNLTRDVELRYSQTNTAIGKCGIAVNRRFNTNGELRDETCFVDISFFGRTAEVANQYLKKGSKVLIEGRLKFDQWVDQNGQNRSKHSIAVDNMEMLDSRPQNGGYNQQPNMHPNSYDNGYQNQGYQNQGGYGGYNAQNGGYGAQNGGYNGGYDNRTQPQHTPPQNQASSFNAPAPAPVDAPKAPNQSITPPAGDDDIPF